MTSSPVGRTQWQCACRRIPWRSSCSPRLGAVSPAPSANRYGKLSSTRAEHVREELGEVVKVILDGGESQIGLESTIVSPSRGQNVRLLRPGGVTAAQIRQVVGELLIGANLESPRVPGGTPSHYAPTTPMAIVPSGEIDARRAPLCPGRRTPGHGTGFLTIAFEISQVRDVDQRRPSSLRSMGTICTRTLRTRSIVELPADSRAGCA